MKNEENSSNNSTVLQFDSNGNLVVGCFEGNTGTISVYKNSVYNYVKSFHCSDISKKSFNDIIFDKENNLVTVRTKGDPKIYIHDGVSSKIKMSFYAPDNFPLLLSFDPYNNLMVIDRDGNSYKYYTS